LLEQTPRLSLSLQASTIQDTEVQASITATCLSPRIETIDGVDVQLLDGTLLDSIPAIDAGHEISTSVQLEFTSANEGENVTIRVGNEFSGYYRFLVSFISGGTTLDPLVIGGITIAVVAIVIVVIYLIRKR
ncbi:MAG: hypothetical protein KAQ65_11250, partial [Candidatus Thorarchaeota archaeon]|nr:hypothetical protein [Candidatus Thorarchaeota archaeon]